MPKNRTRRIILAFFLILGIAAVVLLLAGKHLRIHGYDQRQDYSYSFSEESRTVLTVRLAGGRIQLPAGSGSANSTALLEVKVRADLSGTLFVPRLMFSSGNIAAFQDFEYGVSGIRYVDLSRFIRAGEMEVRLTGRHLAVPDQDARLILYENGLDRAASLLVLAPHPDDAEIAAFGLYRARPNAAVVTITAGDAGRVKYEELYADPAQSYRKKGEIRVWNSITIPLLGGVKPERIANLGYFDGTLQAMQQDKARPVSARFSGLSGMDGYRAQNIAKLLNGVHAEPTWNSLVADLGRVLAAFRPEVIVTPWAELDPHSDHKLTTEALCEALTREPGWNGRLYLYATHNALTDLHPFGEAGGLAGLPPHFGTPLRIPGLHAEQLDADLQRDKLLAIEAMADVRPDTEWRTVRGSFNMFWNAVAYFVSGSDKSYLRRGVRANEIFYAGNRKEICGESR